MTVYTRSTWALIAAAVAAVVTVTAAALVVVGDTSSPGTEVTEKAVPAPRVAWSLDAATYLGRPFADFSDPRGGASFNSGTPGFVRAGNTLVTVVGVPNDAYSLDDAVMIGIDLAIGSVRWKAPAADIEGCSGTPLDGEIYCFATSESKNEIVTYDIDSGKTERRSIKEFVFGIATTSDTLYIVEGSPEENDVRVHAGTFDNVSAKWTRGFDIGADWEGVYENDNILTVTDGVGLVRTGAETAQFAADSGTEVWKGTECISDVTLEAGGVVMQSDTDCGTSGKVSDQLLRSPDGKVLAKTVSAVRQAPSLEQGSRKQEPIVLGDAAYDRVTGKRLWTSKDLVAGEDLGTATALVGTIAYLRDTVDESETGIDLKSGKRLWHNTTTEHFTPRAGKDDVVAGDDGQALTAFDVKRGRRLWAIPFSSLDPDPETFRSGGAMVSNGDGWVFSSDRRMIGLAPR